MADSISNIPINQIIHMNPDKQIFLSYSRTDREASIALCSALTQAGLSVFHDKDGIRIGDRWLEQLEKALQNCSAFVVLIGRDGVQRWVGAEVQVALNLHLTLHDDTKRFPIFPILLDEVKPESLPPFLTLFQSEQWTPSDALSDELIRAIQAHTIRINTYQHFENCPFLGLSAFAREDAKLFFGRRKETLEALACLGDQQQTNPEHLNQSGGLAYLRWLQIEGNSGAGKSSLVNAGMLPMIEQSALWARTGFDNWRILGSMMPGRNPVEKLAEILEQGLKDNPAERDSLKQLKCLEEDPRALAFTIRNFKHTAVRTAFLLIIDQFEELFTFADDKARKQFDALLATALQDPECPLFLISTVRADFLDRFEYLPRLQTLYNSHCKRYFLPNISEHGLREVIEQPARLAGLDVSQVTIAILEDAKDEIGALPLVENALFTLWQQREGKQLSGEHYRRENGIAGMLRTQADKLLQRIDLMAPKGKQAALELLLRLTRINDDGRHSRQRILRKEALFVAGNGDDALGERVLRILSGERSPDTPASSGHNSALRLITIEQKQAQQYVDLIHETLIRARGKDEKTGKLVGYWPTLYDYIEKNRDRDLYRQQLSHESRQWQQSKGLGRLWNLNYFGLKKYRVLRVPIDSVESYFLAWSQRVQFMLILLLSGIALYGAESIVWLQKNDLPPDMMWTLQRFRFGEASFPVLTEKPIPAGSFNMGEWNEIFIENLGNHKSNFGVPGKLIEINQPFYLSKTEITYEQFDYYVWQQQRSENENITYPATVKGGRGDQPVVNVSLYEAIAYTSWLSEQIRSECRLPTEAEWEYAARAGAQTAYPWGDEVGINNANCNNCGSQWDSKQSAPVGSFPANKFGLQDMLGNVWEWTCSNWREQFDGSEQQCNTDASDPQFHVLRGGSWDLDPNGIRLSSRNYYFRPTNRSSFVGFRVLCSSPIE